MDFTSEWNILRKLSTDARCDEIPKELQSAQSILYDLQANPKEENNIASTHRKIVADLHTKLDGHWTPKIAKP